MLQTLVMMNRLAATLYVYFHDTSVQHSLMFIVLHLPYVFPTSSRVNRLYKIYIQLHGISKARASFYLISQPFAYPEPDDTDNEKPESGDESKKHEYVSIVVPDAESEQLIKQT
jgi:hypothetical protein